ncbi:MAG: 1-phosphofructokinase [Pelosinus sp.]|nr:1-phosphofructokinase [Pelosinus sp.]
MTSKCKKGKIVTITLNPALDRTLYMPRFLKGQVNRVECERTDPGGKGINVAKAVKALEQDVVVTGFLGENNTELFTKYFQQENIEEAFVRVTGNTRVNIKVVDEENSEVTEINFSGVSPTKTDFCQLEDKIYSLAKECEWIVLSGNLPSNMPIDIYAQFIKNLHKYNCKVILDTSGEALQAGILAKPYAVKPNIDELSALLGKKITMENGLAEGISYLKQAGISLIVVSMGQNGALAVNDSEAFLVKPPVVTVGSTVGAGDTMVAGLAVGLARGLDLAETMRLSAAAAAAAVMLPGTQAATLQTVNNLLAQVQITTWRR